VGVGTTLLFGTIPALRASAISPDSALKMEGGKQSTKIGILRPLLAAQVGFSFAVLFVAGLLLLSFQKLTNVDLGFNKTGVILFSLDAKDLKGDKARVAELQLLDHVRQIPAVQSAGLSGSGLIGGAFGWVITPTIRIPGHEPVPHGAAYLEVSPGFFGAMQIRVLDGREFIPRDTEAEPASAVIINQAFARQYFPGENPLGRRFEQRGDDPQMIPQRIVGIVRDAKYNNLREGVRPTIYAPLRRINGATLEVRTTADPLAVASTLRQEIPRVDQALRVTSVTLQSTRIDNTLLGERLLALLAGFFAMVAIVLAAVGLYGVLTHAVIRRTKEIGIRIALGARQWMVVRLILTDITLATVMGLIAGIAGGIAFARVLAAVLFEVKPSDFWSLALPLACLLLASAMAAIPPAVRAARVDPIVALRHE
jgi:predicted permease